MCRAKIGHSHLGRRSDCTLPDRALPHTHSLTESRSKVSCRACTRVCFYLQSTCARSGHDTRVDRTSSKTCPKICWSGRIIHVRLFFSHFTIQPGPILQPIFKGSILMHFERRPPPHTVEQRRGRRAVANGGPAHASVFMAPRARRNDVLLRRRRGRALSLGRRGSLCAETAATACNHQHRIAPTIRKHQEAQAQHRAAPSRRIVASEKCMFQ